MIQITVLITLFFIWQTCFANLAEFQEKLKASKTKTNEILSSIFTKWQIKEYPNFLNSVGMSHTAWEVLKLKYEAKILSAFSGKKEKFVISFLGSSVTAGHDTHFNLSFPVLTGKVMEAPFNILGVTLESRNAAMGNNPCLPYDVCMHSFAGKDADIVHWEQSYNCGTNDRNKCVEFEQFIRQGLSLPNQAVVVFSDSMTPNWGSKDCDGELKSLPPLSDVDKERLLLIDTDPIKLVSEINMKAHADSFSSLKDMLIPYKIAGIQTWIHYDYGSYKCHGPYTKDWGCCSQSWHPSLKGHELRADHHAYFWLLIFRDALDSLLKIENIEEAHAKVLKHIHHEHKYIPITPLYTSNFTEGLTCYTTFLPNYDSSLSLFNLVLPSISKELSSTDGKEHSSVEGNKQQQQLFQTGIMEDFMDVNIVKKAKSQGYLDYKQVLYGNNQNIPLSFQLDVTHTGYIHICESPGNWGSLPKGFKSFYKGYANAYITSNITSYSSNSNNDWKFDINKAKHYDFRGGDGSQMICSQLDGIFDVGKYVLTLVPTGEEKIMISYLIIP